MFICAKASSLSDTGCSRVPRLVWINSRPEEILSRTLSIDCSAVSVWFNADVLRWSKRGWMTSFTRVFSARTTTLPRQIFRSFIRYFSFFLFHFRRNDGYIHVPMPGFEETREYRGCAWNGTW